LSHYRAIDHRRNRRFCLCDRFRVWRRNGQRFLIEFNREPVGSIDEAFAANAAAAGPGSEVVARTTRHTRITWLAIEGVDPNEICRNAGITMEMFEEVCAHHHSDFMSGVHRGFNRHRLHRQGNTNQTSLETNVRVFPNAAR